MQPDNDLYLPLFHVSHALSKWMKNVEGREEEETGGGSMSHHGCVQHLLAVPASNKSTPHTTDLYCRPLFIIVSLCFLCSAVHKPFTPLRVSSFAPRSLSITWQFMRNTVVQFHFNNNEFMFVPPLIFIS